MFKNHPNFKQPDDETIKIWRYMDLTKFIYLLEHESLFFSRADLLGDPFEGSWPKPNIRYRDVCFEQYLRDSEMEKIDKVMGPPLLSKNFPRYVAVNCWHSNNFESAAMWQLYLKSNEGIAIQSTYKLLKDSLIDSKEIYIGCVEYLDYEKDEINTGNMLAPFVHKRKSFEHEREIRALILRPPASANKKIDLSIEVIENGIPIKVNLITLIQKVYVSPYSPKWFIELVKGVINRYGYSFDVINSDINSSPLF